MSGFRRISTKRAALLASTALCVAPFLAALPAAAQDATWLNAPGSGDFNTAANWSPGTVPTGTAFFDTSATTSLSLGTATVGGWTFNAGASNYDFTNSGIFEFSGAGIAVNGGSATIINSNGLYFNNTSSAGSAGITNNYFGQFFDSSSAGSSAITNNGILLFSGSSSADSATITNPIGAILQFFQTSTAGTAAITNGNLLEFRGASSADGATITNNNLLEFFDNSSADGAAITNGAFGNTDFSFSTGPAGDSKLSAGSLAGGGTFNLGANELTVGGNNLSTNVTGIIADGGGGGGTGAKLIKTGAGTLTLSGVNTYTGATTVNGGTLEISGSIASGTVTNNAHLAYIGTATAGNAAITNGASATTDFSLSTGPNGDNKLSAGSINGGGNFRLGQNELTVGGNNLPTNVTGIIADGGLGGGTGASLIKTGAATLTLSGINTYTGATTVDAGTLRINGSIAASSGVTVNSGGTLAGAGIVGNTIVNGGGTLLAGNGAGTALTVNGTLGLNAASTYAVDVNPATSSFANVSGAATLGGATVNAIFAPGSYVSKKYTILTAGSINGTFGTLTNTNISPNFHDSLSYDATHAYLNLDLTFTTPAAGTINGNQNNVANALIHSFNSNGGIPLTFAMLSAPALSQAAGESATGSQQGTFNAMTQFVGLMTDPFTAGRSDGANAPAYAGDDVAANAASSGNPRSKGEREAYAALYSKAPVTVPFVARWNVWGAGFGGSQTTDGNTTLGSNNTTSRLFGVAAGADYFFSPSTVAGFALAGGGTSFSVANAGSGRSDLFQAGAFIRHSVGAAYLTGALAYGWQDVTTDRTVTIAGIDRLRARFNANTFSGRAEAGYRFVSPWIGGVGITPYAAGQFTTFELPAYTEQVVSGANTFALAYAAKSVTATRSELGFRADKSFAIQNAILTLRGRAAWAHDFNPDRAVGATFQTLPGASFVVNGARQASDAALTTASAEIKWMNGWSATGTFEGEFSNVTRSYAGKGVARYTW